MSKTKQQIANQNRAIMKELLTELVPYDNRSGDYNYNNVCPTKGLALYAISEVLCENNSEPHRNLPDINILWLRRHFSNSVISKSKAACRKLYDGDIDMKGLCGYMRFFTGEVQVASILSYEQNLNNIGQSTASYGSNNYVGV